MVWIGQTVIEARTVSCPAAETTSFWISVKKEKTVDTIDCKKKKM